MKSVTVKQLIGLLEEMNPEAEVVLEGCDCASECVGLSKGDEAYKGQVVLRTEDGVFGLDELNIKVPK